MKVELESTNIGGTLVTLYDGEEMVACLEYVWIQDYEDMKRADRGEPPQGGAILYVANVAVAHRHRGFLRYLHEALPPHRYIVGLRLLAPKGLPEDFYAKPLVPVSV